MFLFARSASRVIANSDAGRAFIDAELDSRVQCDVIPNAVPLSEIDAVAPLSRDLVGVREGHEMILFAGRFSREKNLKVLFEGVRQVLDARPRAIAFFCGEGPERLYWQDWVRKQNMTDRMLLPGFVHQISAWMKSADVLAFPSLYEGFPNVVMEAMATYCPLVISDIPPHREIVNEQGAILVAPDSVASLRDAIHKVLNDRPAAVVRAHYARQKALQFSIPTMTQAYEAIYQEVIQCSGTRATGREMANPG